MPTTFNMPLICDWQRILACAAIAALCWRPAGAPACRPSIRAHAMRDARLLSASPRPIASEANAKARAFIVSELTAHGPGRPTVQTALAQKSSMDRRRHLQVALGMVNNVVVLHSRQRARSRPPPALLIATSYDRRNAAWARRPAQVPPRPCWRPRAC